MISSASFPALRRTLWVTAFILIFVSAFNLSGTERSGLQLDPSWQAVLEYASIHHFQFGTQIVFTYGPLGYLAAPSSLGHLPGPRIAFAFFWSFVIALTAMNLARRLPLWASVALLAWLAAFPLAEGMDQTAFWVLASSALLMIFDVPNERWQCSIYLFAFTILALIKTSFLTAATASLIIVLVLWIAQRKMKQALAVACAMPLGFMVCWIACGQSASHVGLWIWRGMQLESGYSAAMNLTPKSSVLACAVLGLAVLASVTGSIVFGRERNSQRWAAGLILEQYGFLAWKEGFTRSGDWHAYVFLWYLPLGAAFVLLPELSAGQSLKVRRAVFAAFAASIALAILGSNLQIAGFAWSQFAGWPQRFADHTREILEVSRGHAENLFAKARDPRTTPLANLEHASDVVGDKSVDIMNYLQQAAIVNELNYQPRPVFQGFVAYTSDLQTLNKDYYESAQRPQFVMLAQQATDRRFPTLEDSAALNFALNNYVPVARDGSFLILQQSTTADLNLKPAYEAVVHFGDSIDLRPWSGAPLFMSAEIDLTLPGRAATILYQPAPLSIRVASGESEHRYRIVASMAQQPFLISPVLDSNSDVLKLCASQPGKTTDRITFESPVNATWEFRNSFRVRLFTAPKFPRAAMAISPSRVMADVQDRVFWPTPTSVASATPARLSVIHGTAAVVVAAPSKIVLNIPPGAVSFSGYFGLARGDSSEMARPVRIFIEVEDAQGRSKVKLDQTLELSLPLNRNRFPFRVPVGGGSDRTITLRTDSVGIVNDGSTVSFWSHLRFEMPAPSN